MRVITSPEPGLNAGNDGEDLCHRFPWLRQRVLRDMNSKHHAHATSWPEGRAEAVVPKGIPDRFNRTAENANRPRNHDRPVS